MDIWNGRFMDVLTIIIVGGFFTFIAGRYLFKYCTSFTIINT